MPRPGFLRWGCVGSESEIPGWTRMHLIPRNRFFNAYVHRYAPGFEDDRQYGLHDHAWWSLSIALAGRLYERFHPLVCGIPHTEATKCHIVPRIFLRPPRYSHAVSNNSETRPAYTLFMTGPRVRPWGFWCKPHHWRNHERVRQEGCD